MLVVRRVERGGGGIAKPLHVYLCFVFCVGRMRNQGAYRNLFPFPGYQSQLRYKLKSKLSYNPGGGLG